MMIRVDGGKRHEIIGGAFRDAGTNLRHQAILLNLGALLKAFLDAYPLGRVFVAPADVVLSEIDVVEPDLLFVSSARLDRLTKANVQGAPDLVIEILSPSTRKTDEVTKHKRYEHFDVIEIGRRNDAARPISVDLRCPFAMRIGPVRPPDWGPRRRG